MSGNIIVGGVFYRIIPGYCAWARSAPDKPQPNICDLTHENALKTRSSSDRPKKKVVSI